MCCSSHEHRIHPFKASILPTKWIGGVKKWNGAIMLTQHLHKDTLLLWLWGARRPVISLFVRFDEQTYPDCGHARTSLRQGICNMFPDISSPFKTFPSFKPICLSLNNTEFSLGRTITITPTSHPTDLPPEDIYKNLNHVQFIRDRKPRLKLLSLKPYWK